MKNRKNILVLALAIVLLYAGFALYQSDYFHKDGLISYTPTATPTPTVKKINITNPPGVTNAPGTSSYADTLKKYADRLLQFDAGCQMSPSFVTYKNGASVMLDNRSNQPRTITINGDSYSLLAYGWRVVVLNRSASALPFTYNIDCDSQQNVGQILLQK